MRAPPAQDLWSDEADVLVRGGIPVGNATVRRQCHSSSKSTLCRRPAKELGGHAVLLMENVGHSPNHIS